MMLVLTACGGSRAIAPVESMGYSVKTPQAQYAPRKPPTFYSVKQGDTLYSISWRYGMDYKTLARINNISAPYLLSIGQRIRFKAIKPVKTASKPELRPNITKPARSTSKPKPTATPTANTRLVWQWPTEGKVISTYSKSANNRKGIKIAGNAGQAVVAAASGKVVYAGSGLPRYGNLLIVKHNDVYLSAYAHNTTLVVNEGDHVKTGQKIATLGSTGTQRNQLHFEVRRNGKPVDPMRFLPKR